MAVGRKIKPYNPLKNSPLKDSRAELREQQAQLTRSIMDMKDQFEARPITNLAADYKNVFAGAENVYAGAKNVFEGATNQFANLENPFEDLTVNTQQAEFERDQFRQSQANLLQNLGGAAGTSGVAGLAQSLANAGANQARQSSASIGQQEAQNKMAAAQGAMQTQMAAAQGAQSAEMARLQGAAQQQQMVLGGAAAQQQMQLEGAARQQDAKLAGAQAQRQLDFERMQGIMSLEAGMLQGAREAEESRRSMIAKFFVSDRRLKENISLIGKSPSGINIYKFEYKDKSIGEGVYQGVMADEVSKNAITKHTDGYYMVDYSKLDVDFIKI
jgi:hypothetical protein